MYHTLKVAIEMVIEFNQQTLHLADRTTFSGIASILKDDLTAYDACSGFIKLQVYCPPDCN